MLTPTSTSIGDLWAAFVVTPSPVFRDELISEYAPLVRYVADRFGLSTTNVIEQDDLIDAGIIGLIKAINCYDPTEDRAFEAFATAYIRDALMDQFYLLGWWRHTTAARARQLDDAQKVLQTRLGRLAKEEEVATELNVTPTRYRSMLKEAGTMLLFLDAPLDPLPLM